MTSLRRAQFLTGTAAAVAANGTAAAQPAAGAQKPFHVLVLSGGGAFGSYEAGVISRLPSLGISYDVVCGTSIGALNGALYASSQTARLANLWHTIGSRTVVALPTDLEPRASTAVLARPLTLAHRLLQTAFGKVDGVFAAAPVRTLLQELFLEQGGTRVVPFTTPCFWAVTNVSDMCGNYYYRGPQNALQTELLTQAFAQKGGRLKTLSPRQPGAFVEALRASAAIPAFFQPAYAGVDVFVDGGVVNNTPFDVAKIARRLLGPGRPLEIHVVFNAPAERRVSKEATRNGLGVLLACYDIMQKRLVDEAARLTVREAALATRMSAGEVDGNEHLRDARDVAISVVRPDSELEGTLADFTDQKAIDANFERGARDIERGWKPYEIPGEFCATAT